LDSYNYYYSFIHAPAFHHGGGQAETDGQGAAHAASLTADGGAGMVCPGDVFGTPSPTKAVHLRGSRLSFGKHLTMRSVC